MGVRLNDLRVGDTWSFNVAAADYPAGEWTMTLYLVPRFTAPVQSIIDLTSTASDSEHQFAVAASVTATYEPGQYGFATVVTDRIQRFTLDGSEWAGEVILRPDPAAATQGDDHRTAAQKAIEDLKAALSSYTASNGHVSEYEINGRRMKFRSILEITELIDFWQKERAAEIRRDAISRGMADPRKVYVAFNR
jgi:hypothetical protein